MVSYTRLCSTIFIIFSDWILLMKYVYMYICTVDWELEYSYLKFIHAIHHTKECVVSHSHKMAASLEFSFSYKGKEYLFVEETKKTLEALQSSSTHCHCHSIN